MTTIKLYHVNFMRGGVWRPVCEAEELEQYGGAELILSYSSELDFTTEQGALKVRLDNAAQVTSMRNVNYAAVSIDGTDEYTLYWVENVNISPIIGAAGTYFAYLTITVDDVQTYFLPRLWHGTAGVRGNVVQTNNLRIAAQTRERQSAIAPIYSNDPFKGNYSSRRWGYVQQAGTFVYVLIALSTQDGGTVTLLQQFRPDELLLLAQKLGNVSKFKVSNVPDTELNASILGAWLLPTSFFSVDGGYTVIDFDVTATVTFANESTQDFHVFKSPPADSRITFCNVLKWGEAPEIATGLGGAAYVMTPARTIRINMPFIDYGDATSWDIPVFLQWTPRGVATEKPHIFIGIDGGLVEVTDDFALTYATNSKAVEQSQQGELVALQSIATIIGGVGGTIGAAVSGNVFGAVSSTVAAVSSLAEMGAARQRPAELSATGNAMAALFTQGLFGIYVVEPENKDDINGEITVHGPLLPSKPYKALAKGVDGFLGGVGNGEYYKFDVVNIYGCGGGERACEAAAQLFRDGIVLTRTSS